MGYIGNKIIEIRKSKGLTQEELAEKARVNLRTIQRIEANENIPRGSTLNLISEALEISSHEFKEDFHKKKFEYPQMLIIEKNRLN